VHQLIGNNLVKGSVLYTIEAKWGLLGYYSKHCLSDFVVSKIAREGNKWDLNFKEVIRQECLFRFPNP
jgi:hypothetical protein